MVRITIDINSLEIRMEGHACTAEKGKDLVCCALSTLIETLSRYLENQLAEGMIYNLEENIEEGDSYIRATPFGWSRKDTETAFRVVREGVRAIAAEYNKNVTLEEV